MEVERNHQAIFRAVSRSSTFLMWVGSVEVWGDGQQTRSYLYIDECIEDTRRLMDSDFMGPVNIGSEEMVRINDLVEIVSKVLGKPVQRRHKLIILLVSVVGIVTTISSEVC